MFVPVIDQSYYLSVRDNEGPLHDPDPKAPESFWVEPHRDFMYVQCMDEDSDRGVELVVSVWGEAPDDLHQWDDFWPGHIYGEWEVTGPVVVCTLEGWEVEQLFDGPGRYGFLYLARKEEDPEPGDAEEVHSVFLWPLDGQAVYTGE